MKRKDLVKLLEQNGWYLIRQGSNHEIYTDGSSLIPLPRHKEINENTAKGIIKKIYNLKELN